ncbi:glycoside hydrolase family 76 protein [Mucilaginibacter rubeus]|uniref:glycoside hydrolase family 76 protein n=1 Tax=Mucilaginibacter rubeus TaxID=2027860 RepID=UPI00166D238C|nr:glycoside hydrolase family 76 protein [Mucilaginibacter rubeus]GGB03912.1 glycoside hydrolase [Mucilaginibacter rubeus]
MKNKLLNIATAVLVGGIAMTFSSCLKDKPFPLYGNKASAKVQYKYAETADSLQEKTYTTFISANGNYFVANNAGSTTFNYWPNAHTLDIFTDAYLRTNNDIYKQRMSSLLAGIKTTNGGLSNNFYDDMEWLDLATLRAYNATKDAAYLTAAHTLWTDIQTGENSNQGGGIAWRKNQLDYKNTPANAPAIIFAARLYALEKNEADLATAKRLYTWLKKTLLDPSGIIWDGINANGDGQISKWKFTYNQGVFIGASLELYHVTKDAAYLTDAVNTANASINDTDISPGGILKSEGQGDGGLFKGILIRYLTLLALDPDIAETDRTKFISFLKFNAETLYTAGIERPSLMISPDWKKKPSGTTDLTTQLSGVMMVEAAATLKSAGKF